MAATETRPAGAGTTAGTTASADRPVGPLLLAAALALPGMQPAAQAETAPENGMIGLRTMHYKDRQPGLDRIEVSAPSVVFLVPIAGEWSVAGGAIRDNISGASPRYHSAISGASRMDDRRNAHDLTVTRYLPGGSIAFGSAHSSERDYISTAYSVQASVASEDRNTTWRFGLGTSRDRINPVDSAISNERRKTTELVLGVTRVLTMRDILQLSLTHARAEGYMSDPYKIFDQRPRTRTQNVGMARWNHHFDASEGTSRLSVTYAHDSFGGRSYTFAEEYVQPVAQGWTLTPSVRLYSQSAARFYLDPVYAFGGVAPFPIGFPALPEFYSQDQRLSAFGARTIGLKVAKELGAGWSADARIERYEQRSSWRLFGSGSPGLDPLIANWIELGIYRRW